MGGSRYSKKHAGALKVVIKKGLRALIREQIHLLMILQG
jgi:hypothetical protein